MNEPTQHVPSKIVSVARLHSALVIENLRNSSFGEARDVLEQILHASDWLPHTLIRRAFAAHQELTPIFLEAVNVLAAVGYDCDSNVRLLGEFGVVYLAENRDRRLMRPLIRLLKIFGEEPEYFSIFSERIFREGSLILAAASPMAAYPLFELAVNGAVDQAIRGRAMYAIAILKHWGEISRAEAVRWVRLLFRTVQQMDEPSVFAYWGLAAAMLAGPELQREIECILASNRLNDEWRSLISAHAKVPADVFLELTYSVEPRLFRILFKPMIREGETGMAVMRRTTES